ncbi:unnamed protein product [Closterium sp. NIES-64]|nr:unnamed protein product [Closterium sp. NIES-64]
MTPFALPHLRSSLPRLSTPLPHLRSSLPRLSTALPHLRSSLPRLRSTPPRPQSSLPRPQSPLPWPQSSLPQPQSSLSRPQSSLPPSRLALPTNADDLRADADGQRVATNDLRADAAGQLAIADDPRADADGQRDIADHPRADTDGQRDTADHPRADADGQRATADHPLADADGQRAAADHPRADADGQRAATNGPRVHAYGQRAAAEDPASMRTAGAEPRLICAPSHDLATIDTLKLLGDNSAANWHSYAHSVEVLLSSVIVSGYTLPSVVFQEEGGPALDKHGPEPEPPGDPPSFAPDVNNPQSAEFAILAYRTSLNDHLRRQLRYDDDKRTYDSATARHREYQAQLATYTTRLATYTTDIVAWCIADRRALAILLATIPSSLKRELSPTSSSHLFDRQDIATLYALIKEFGSIIMDSTAGAAAFTCRVLDLARRLAALGVVYPDTVICCHLLEALTPAFDARKLAYMQLLSKHDTPAQSDTTPPPLLPPPPILPSPPPPPSQSHGAPPSSGDIFDPDPLSSPVSPTHSSPGSPPPPSLSTLTSLPPSPHHTHPVVLH